jgi:hypothetical protein
VVVVAVLIVPERLVAPLYFLPLQPLAVVLVVAMDTHQALLMGMVAVGVLVAVLAGIIMVLVAQVLVLVIHHLHLHPKVIMAATLVQQMAGVTIVPAVAGALLRLVETVRAHQRLAETVAQVQHLQFQDHL